MADAAENLLARVRALEADNLRLTTAIKTEHKPPEAIPNVERLLRQSSSWSRRSRRRESHEPASLTTR
jgi:hypothetical protein